MKRTLKLIPALIAGAFVLSACSIANTAPDQVGLHYKGGPFSSTKFANCISSGNRNIDGPADKHFFYPAGQRTFDFSGIEGSDSGRIQIVSKDNITMDVAGVLTFELNTDCDTLRKFHETIGLKFKAWMSGNDTGDGWVQMLNVYMKQPLDRAMDNAAQKLNWKDLYNNPDARAAWEDEVEKAITGFIQANGGGEFFLNFNITLQKPEPPQNLRDALTAEQEAITRNNAQVKENVRLKTKYDTFADCKKQLSEQSCIQIYAIDSGRVSVVPLPAGSNFNVNAGGGGNNG